VIEIRRNPAPDGGFVVIFSDITERKRSEAEKSVPPAMRRSIVI
jgi:hypothetical protein